MIKKNKHGGKRKRAGAKPKNRNTTQLRTTLDTFIVDELLLDRKELNALLIHYAVHKKAGHGVFIFDKEKDFLI